MRVLRHHRDLWPPAADEESGSADRGTGSDAKIRVYSAHSSSTTTSSATRRRPKQLLRAIVAWQKQHGYPLRLTTEASIDLADDSELLELMYRANFRAVFIGIETPRVESLKETKKFQNVAGDSLDAKLARIQNAGLDINAGFIVGFDSDDK